MSISKRVDYFAPLEDVTGIVDHVAPLLNLSALDARILEQILLGDSTETAAAYCGVSVTTCTRAVKRIVTRAADCVESRLKKGEQA